MGKKTKAAILTLLLSIINSVASVVFSLIYNNYLIRIYGTDINGLIATLTQFVSLFAIVEGGFTTAAIVATYSPIVNKNYDHLNDILYTTKITYLRIGAIITGAVLVFGSVYINFVNSPLSYGKTFSLLFLSVLVTSSSLCFLSKYTVLLQGYNKEYVMVLCSLVARTVTWIGSIFMMLGGVDIVYVYAMNVANIIVNIFLSKYYEKKVFPYITYRGHFQKDLISGTGDVLFQKIASTIFTSTDLVLISTCISLSFASVYNLYYQVFKSVLTLLLSFAQAPFNSFGQLAKEEGRREYLIETFNIYQHLILVISSVILTITGIMIIPFVKVYSTKIHDFNYVYPSLAVLFFLQIFSQVINRPYGTILNATGNFKMQNIQCGAAAVINIVVSLAFIKWIGINSIILGSFVGTLIILGMNVYQAYKNVLKQPMFSVVKNIIANYMVSTLLIVISLQFSYSPKTYIGLVGMACLVCFGVTVVIVMANIIVDRGATTAVFRYAYEKIYKRTKWNT